MRNLTRRMCGGCGQNGKIIGRKLPSRELRLIIDVDVCMRIICILWPSATYSRQTCLITCALHLTETVCVGKKTQDFATKYYNYMYKDYGAKTAFARTASQQTCQYMYVYIYMCMYIYMKIGRGCMYENYWERTVWLRAIIDVSICMCVCVYIYMFVCIHVFMSVNVCVCIYIYVCICTYMRIKWFYMMILWHK